MILLPGGKSKVAQLPSIHGFGMFGRRPTGHFLSRIAGLTMRERVSGVIEMDCFLQRFQIAVVHVGLHEIGPGPLIDISQGGSFIFTDEGFG